jgi:hypothetical protein
MSRLSSCLSGLWSAAKRSASTGGQVLVPRRSTDCATALAATSFAYDAFANGSVGRGRRDCRGKDSCCRGSHALRPWQKREVTP